jgi:DNA-binding beta-propeller fold protein YncE
MGYSGLPRRSVFRQLLMVTCILALLPGSAAAQTGSWRVLLGGDDAFTPHEPSGVAIDDEGFLYVVDTSGSRVERLAPDGRVVATLGHVGTGDDALRRPRGAALDVLGTLLIADTANHRIQRFDTASGAPLGPWGVIGSEPGEFILPTSLALDSLGNVYVADTGNHRIQKLGPDGSFVAQWAGLHFPHGIAIDAQDAVYVTDSNGLHKFSSGGDLLDEWTAAGEFGDPYGVAIGPDGTLYVSDTDNGRVVAMQPSGEVIKAWGRQGAGVGQFHYPEALAVGGDGSLYVADRGNDRVQVLRP